MPKVVYLLAVLHISDKYCHNFILLSSKSTLFKKFPYQNSEPRTIPCFPHLQYIHISYTPTEHQLRYACSKSPDNRVDVMREDGTIVTAKVALRQVTKMLRQRQNECGDLAGVPQLMAGSQSTYTILRLHFHTVKGRSLCQQWYCREKLPSFSLRTPQPYHDLVIPA
jgi:hypothetical protein